MKIKITPDNIQEHLLIRKLKPATSVQALCLHIIQQAQSEGEDHVYVLVHSQLLAPSYLAVPAMFARSLRLKANYSNIQAYVDSNEQFTLYAGNQKKPVTFNQKAIASLERKGSFSCLKDKIPITYRFTPSILSHLIFKQTGLRVAIIAKEKLIKWKLATQSVKSPLQKKKL